MVLYSVRWGRVLCYLHFIRLADWVVKQTFLISLVAGMLDKQRSPLNVSALSEVHQSCLLIF